MNSKLKTLKPGSHSRVALLIALIVLIEAVVVLKVIGLGDAPIIHHDYLVYERLALNLMEHNVFSMNETPPFNPTTFRSPGYPTFIAGIYLLTGRSSMAVGIAQFALLAATSFLLYLLALRHVKRTAAATGAVLCALYPPFVFTAPLFIAEILSMFLLVSGLLILDRMKGTWSYILAGVVLGGAALARPSFVLLPVAIVPFLLAVRRIKGGLLLLAAFVLVVTPWIVRNSLLAGRFLNLATGAGWTLYVSAQQYSGEITYRMLKSEWEVIVDEFNQRTLAASSALPEVAGADPSSLAVRREVFRDQAYLSDAVKKLRSIPVLTYLSSFPRRVFWLWSTADSSPWQIGLLHRLQQLLHIILMGSLFAGALVLRRSLLSSWPLWIVPVYLTVLHMVFHVEARYSLPGRAFLLPICAVGLVTAATYALRRLRVIPDGREPTVLPRI